MEERTFILTVTEQEINIISAGLSELPHKHVAGLIQKLQSQINNPLQNEYQLGLEYAASQVDHIAREGGGTYGDLIRSITRSHK